MISVINLTKKFYDSKRGEVIAADKVTFECKNGTIFGLLGPNGAGKTTILRILATILKPTSGRVYVNDLDVVEKSLDVRRQIGFMSASTGLYERMTAQEMVEYFGRLYGMEEDRLSRRIDEIFDLLEMNDFRTTLTSKLSSGMKQKVSIARTIVHDPPVLIFDEPTASLDIMVARILLSFISSCRSDDKCIIFSTHIMTEAEKLCDEIGIIHHGKLLAVGTPDELKDGTGQNDLEEAFFDIVKREEE